MDSSLAQSIGDTEKVSDNRRERNNASTKKVITVEGKSYFTVKRSIEGIEKRNKYKRRNKSSEIEIHPEISLAY
jgi:hypothetical protein